MAPDTTRLIYVKFLIEREYKNMQIDFHHSLIYVLSRLAGFTKEESKIISYSSQYVDDSVKNGIINFENGCRYSLMSTAHKTLDWMNLLNDINFHVWVPFHFLPGNKGLEAHEIHEGEWIEKLVCQPDSHIAREVIEHCFGDSDKPYYCHEIGLIMHVYADTWSHQRFVGISHNINSVDLCEELPDEMDNIGEKIKSSAVSKCAPLGHGSVLEYPDYPYLEWRYTDTNGAEIINNNPETYILAADRIFEALCKLQKRDKGYVSGGIPKRDRELIYAKFKKMKDPDPKFRHENWLQSIKNGKFSFGSEEINYISSGYGSWEYEVFKQEPIMGGSLKNEEYEAFLNSDWKKFHDSVHLYRFRLTHEILPKYGIYTV